MRNRKMKITYLNWYLFLMGMLVVFSCSDDEPIPMSPEAGNIVEVAQGNNQFTLLVAAVSRAGLVEALSAPGPLTVFAPTNQAFNEAGITDVDDIPVDQLRDILLYHVVEGAVPSSEIESGGVTSMNASPIFISQDTEGAIWINGSSEVVTTDIEASNGIIHVVDEVIFPPSQSIAEIAVGYSQSDTPEFTQLVGALSRAELVEAVSGGTDDNLTVFAPTDAAFEELYILLGVNGYEEIPLETLTEVLTYHVVPAREFSQDLREGSQLPTLSGENTLRVNLENLQINESDLVPTLLNVHATNGVIHVINKVLLP